MIRTVFSLFIFLALSPIAIAAEVKMTGAEITIALSDKELVADGEITQLFQATGLTMYSERGSHSQGKWKVENDKYCSVWPPSEFWACYDVVKEGDIITFVSSSGGRFPMTPKPVSE
jgi:hypothetical protein